MNRFLLAVLFLLLCASQSWAQAMSIDNVQLPGDIHRITATWTSDGSGAVSGTVEINGVILRVVTDPGSPSPTSSWGVACNDGNGVDLFAGQGASRHATNSETFCPGLKLSDGTNTSVMPMSHYGTATLAVSAAGASKAGSVVIYFKKSKPTN